MCCTFQSTNEHVRLGLQTADLGPSKLLVLCNLKFRRRIKVIEITVGQSIYVGVPQIPCHHTGNEWCRDKKQQNFIAQNPRIRHQMSQSTCSVQRIEPSFERVSNDQQTHRWFLHANIAAHRASLQRLDSPFKNCSPPLGPLADFVPFVPAPASSDFDFLVASDVEASCAGVNKCLFSAPAVSASRSRLAPASPPWKPSDAWIRQRIWVTDDS